MRKIEFKRTAPESVGISVKSILELLDRLEGDYSEIHSLMIMRHDQIITEGWWQPYSPAVRHMMMSASKTFSGTAIGIAVKEGITALDERIADIFPEYIPDNANENLLNITVKDLLCMGSGSEPEVPVDRNWPANYFNETEFKHEPGTEFLYNNAPATLLAQIIRKRTGLNLPEFLEGRLFEKIGIDYDNVTWFTAPNGTTFAPGGLHCTTEDLLRLMRLYLRNGNWDGEQILDEEYVKLATTKRIDSANIFGAAGTDRFSDYVFGYGYMMWMSHGDMGYRAEGAYGQFGIVIPKLDMIIAITQTSTESPVSQTTLDHIWKFAETVQEEALPVDFEEKSLLESRLSRLSVKRDPIRPYGQFPFSGLTYTATGKGAAPYVLFYDPIRDYEEVKTMTGISAFSFRKDIRNPYAVNMQCVINGHKYDFHIPTDGNRILHIVPEMLYASEVLLSGYWQDENTFNVRFRWFETCFTKELSFRFTGKCCNVDERMVCGEDPDLRKGIEYRL
ncbi:MAG: beta-lactamase family protein [Clostridia bacterium]|nr:beta-lactamase family protein [Clostridia bacterium]